MTRHGYCESVFDVLIVVGITDLVMLASVVVGVFFRVQTIQSKIFAFLVPPTCTNACKSGTTRQPADGMYLWVRPTHPKFYALYYNHDIVLVVGRQYKDIMI